MKPSFYYNGDSFPGAWEAVVRYCMRNGVIGDTEYGMPAKSITSKIILNENACKQVHNNVLHPKFPTKEKHLQEYIKQYTPEYEASRFTYTYYDRLTKYPTSNGEFNQLKYLKDNFRNSRRQSIVTWIPEIDAQSDEPPCFQRLQLQKLSEPVNYNGMKIKGNAEYYVDWRSRDLYGAWQSNLCGIDYMVRNEILGNDYNVVCIVDNVNIAHVYKGDWDAAEVV